jgi:hypothetical protein
LHNKGSGKTVLILFFPTQKNMNSRNRELDWSPSQLLLSHGGTLSATLVATTTAFFFLMAAQVGNSTAHVNANRTLGYLWVTISYALGIFGIYLVNGTWQENTRIKRPTFGPGGFIALIVIFLLAIATNTTTLVYLVQYE